MSHETGAGAMLIVYIAVMVAVVVAVDIIFFRHVFWRRLVANVLIVLVFLAFYLLVLRRR